ncbi:hypothetical protein Emag_007907 [Eimeria magna]
MLPADAAQQTRRRHPAAEALTAAATATWHAAATAAARAAATAAAAAAADQWDSDEGVGGVEFVSPAAAAGAAAAAAAAAVAAAVGEAALPSACARDAGASTPPSLEGLMVSLGAARRQQDGSERQLSGWLAATPDP